MLQRKKIFFISLIFIFTFTYLFKNGALTQEEHTEEGVLTETGNGNEALLETPIEEPVDEPAEETAEEPDEKQTEISAETPHNETPLNKFDLKKDIEKILPDTWKKGKSGIKVVNLSRSNTVYELNSAKLFIPASNMKLITAAAALKKLYPDYRFKTTLSTDAKTRGAVLKGNLYIKGFGDPRLVSEELWMIVRELYKLGIREITGDIVGDTSFFDNEGLGNGWGKKITSMPYHAKIGALSLNFNSIAIAIEPGNKIGGKPLVTIDPDTKYINIDNQATTVEGKGKNNFIVIDRMPIANNRDNIQIRGRISKNASRSVYYRNISYPKNYTLMVFKEFLIKEGIKVSGNIRTAPQPEKAIVLLEHKSMPLSVITYDMNKISNNFVAEQVLKAMGAEIKGLPGTDQKGVEVISEFLNEIGIPKDSYIIKDGSGLSKENRLSPDIFIKVLEYMYEDFYVAPEYISSLGIVGVDGSVKKRFNGSSIRRKIRAKTGTLVGSICLSGYARDSSGDVLAFSILTNDNKISAYNIMKLHEKILSIVLR